MNKNKGFAPLIIIIAIVIVAAVAGAVYVSVQNNTNVAVDEEGSAEVDLGTDMESGASAGVISESATGDLSACGFYKEANVIYLLETPYSGSEVIRGQVVDGADPTSFTCINNIFAKDNNYLYLNNSIPSGSDSYQRVGQIDGQTFVMFLYGDLYGGYGYARDANVNYKLQYSGDGIKSNRWQLVKVDTAFPFDVASMKIVGGCGKEKDFVKDNQSVYVFYIWTEDYLDLENSDPATFRIVEGTVFAKDKNQTYCSSDLAEYCGDIVRGEDPAECPQAF